MSANKHQWGHKRDIIFTKISSKEIYFVFPPHSGMYQSKFCTNIDWSTNMGKPSVLCLLDL